MPLARHDGAGRTGGNLGAGFLLTCLLRGMTAYQTMLTGKKVFLLTCLLRGMTGVEGHPAGSFYVSTHMPLARHDISTRIK